MNKYTTFEFDFSIYNYSLKRHHYDYEFVHAKSIDDAEKIFWKRMNGRDVKIFRVYYTEVHFKPSYSKRGRTIWDKCPVNYKYDYESDGKTRSK